MKQHSISQRRACRLTRLARSTKRRVLREADDSRLKTRLCELARKRQRFGYRRLTVLLQREGWTVNHKRIYRLYRQQGLALRRKRHGHRMRQLNAATEKNMLTKRNQRWAMDFVSDTLASGRPFRSLTIVDEYTRECPAIEVDTSLPGQRVIRVLRQLADTGGLPNEIRVDHGPEFVSRSVRSWCEEHHVLLRYTDPGRPMHNGHVESCNGRFRDECLNANWFTSLAHARHTIENWRDDYNRNRPHSALNYRAPFEFAALLTARAAQPTILGNSVNKCYRSKGHVKGKRIIAVIPARDEADVIARAVQSLQLQSYEPPLLVVLVDDSSSDGTADVAIEAAREIGQSHRLSVTPGKPLAPDWTGKLWALSQGVDQALALEPDYLLFTDADIVHGANSVSNLAAIADAQPYDLASFMVKLHCESFAEKALIPAFVFFFLQLYPPAWISSPDTKTAGAAGGWILIRPEALARIGGLAAIRNTAIDDCALAKAVKQSGGNVWMGLTSTTKSIRSYRTFSEIGRMISRTAFTQLNHWFRQSSHLHTLT